MKHFTGKEYLYIDIANHYGLDKLAFEQRIEWVHNNEDRLETFIHQADEKPLYIKAVMALRDAQKGIPSGHRCSLDACASGTQIMSAIIGCESGAYITGMVDPDKRMDAYSELTDTMNDLLGSGEQIKVKRDDAKQAFMTWLYGSEQEPKNVFGEGSKAYMAFFEAMATLVPGAVTVRQLAMDIWQAWQPVHSYQLPDDFEVYLPNVVEKLMLIEPEELEGLSAPVFYKEVQGAKKGIALAAHIIHSLDAMVLRELGRRCDYTQDKQRIEDVFLSLSLFCDGREATDYTQFLSLNGINDINLKNLKMYDMNLLCRLRDLCADVLHYKPFPVEGNHDAFSSHANHMNKVRYWYKEILAELADSNILQDIVNQIAGSKAPVIQKLSEGLGDKIRMSNYALS